MIGEAGPLRHGDGSVLVAGGEDRPAKFASAELYWSCPGLVDG